MMNGEHGYRLIIFDWDGTLVDSIQRIVSSLQHAARSALAVAISERQARDVIGLGLKEAMQQLLPRRRDDEVQRAIDAYKRHYLYLNQVEAPLFRGVLPFLQNLADDGYRLAIATGKSRQGLAHAFREHPVETFFSAVRCASDYRSKPHPEMVDSIRDELGVARRHTLLVGDSIHDLQMARNAGVDGVGVTHGVHDFATLSALRPLYCLDDVTKLHERLESTTPRAGKQNKTIDGA